MPWKILTNIKELEERFGTAELLVSGTLAELQQSYFYWKEKGIVHVDYRMHQTLNVQRLMFYMRILDVTKLIPYITPPESTKRIATTQRIPFELEELRFKGILPYRLLQQETLRRRDITRTEERREKIRLVKLHQQAITVPEQRPLADLESYLYTFHLEWYEKILLKIIDMCKAKQLYLERIVGQEPLEKLMLQMYVPFYMEMPMKMNAIALRLTQATMLYASGLAGTIYSSIQSIGQAIKTKWQLITAQNRRLETKALASGKTRKEKFQTKSSSDYEEHIHGKTKLKVGKDLTGKEIMALALAFSYGIPYYLKRWLVRQMGLPENSKLYRRPYTYFIPVRRTLRRSYRGRRFQRSITTFSRDEYLKNMGRWRSRYG